MRRATASSPVTASSCISLGILFLVTSFASFKGGLLYARFRNLQYSIDSVISLEWQRGKVGPGEPIFGKVPQIQGLWLGTPHRTANETFCGSLREGCAALEEGYVGSMRCGEKDVWVQFGLPLPVRIYQLYHSVENHWQMYDCTHRLYQGLAQTPDALRPDHFDIDSTRDLPILHNIDYQNNLCEYSGIFGLHAGGHIDRQPEPYVGFQSWKAKQKGFALSCEAETSLVRSVRDSVARNVDTFFYWACPGEDVGDITRQFYPCCSEYHGEQCKSMYATGFSLFFNKNTPVGLEDGVPPMPGNGSEWAYMSYFAMPKERLKQYLDFAALFFASLDDGFYSAVVNPPTCPMSNWDPDLPETVYAKRHCFCYLMERLVNIWAYHSGLRFMYIDPKTGDIKETHPREKRTMVPWFLDGSIGRSKIFILRELAKKNGRGIYDQLTRSRSFQAG